MDKQKTNLESDVIDFLTSSGLNEMLGISDQEIIDMAKSGQHAQFIIQDMLKKGHSPIDVLQWFFSSGAGKSSLYNFENAQKIKT